MSESQPDLGAMVSKLLGNPDLISQIASTVGIDQASADDQAPKDNEPVEENKNEAISAGAGIESLLPMLSMMGGGQKGGDSSRRCALLSALKPFCNQHRCRTIDYMIGISKLSETLTNKRG